jgi:hypothetical protein
LSIYRYERRVWLAINGEDGIKLSEQILPAKKLQRYWKKKALSPRSDGNKRLLIERARGESALKTFERTNLASHRQDLEDELSLQDKRKTLKTLEQG